LSERKHRRRGLDQRPYALGNGEMVMPMRPSTPRGSPDVRDLVPGAAIGALKKPLPGPPLSMRHGLRLISQKLA
jgi:hypothetical protein